MVRLVVVVISFLLAMAIAQESRSLLGFANGTYPPVEGYNPLEDIKDTYYFDCCVSAFFGSRSPAETAAIKHGIDRYEADKRILSDAGPEGDLAMFIARLLDPIVWVIAVILTCLGLWMVNLWKSTRESA